MVPFAKTKAQRLAAGDPRLSLEERYGTHDGYVAAVKAAANNAACQGYLLAGPAAAAMGAKCTSAHPARLPGRLGGAGQRGDREQRLQPAERRRQVQSGSAVTIRTVR